MLFTIWILYSASFDKKYTELSSNHIGRFHSHNQFSNKGWKKSFDPGGLCTANTFKKNRCYEKRKATPNNGYEKHYKK